MCNTPVEVQFITSAGCLNYPCRTPVACPDDLAPAVHVVVAQPTLQEFRELRQRSVDLLLLQSFRR
jgi:hypothetical protein